MIKYHSEKKTMCEDCASIAQWLEHWSCVRFPVQAYLFLSVCSSKVKGSKILVLYIKITNCNLKDRDPNLLISPLFSYVLLPSFIAKEKTFSMYFSASIVPFSKITGIVKP